jgi:hypothetical protein
MMESLRPLPRPPFFGLPAARRRFLVHFFFLSVLRDNI